MAIFVATIVLPAPLGTTALMPAGRSPDRSAHSATDTGWDRANLRHMERRTTGGREHLAGTGRHYGATTTVLVQGPPRGELELEPKYRPKPPETLQMEATYKGSLHGFSTHFRGGSAPGGGRPSIALTFDTEIPRSEEARRTLWRVLDVLEDFHVRATFFIVGRWARANREALQRLARDGHEIGNHSATHARFAGRGARALAEELESVSDLVALETGSPIAPLFRPPYGCLDAAGARVAAAQGYRLVGWTASGRDASSSTTDPAEVVEAVGEDLEPGSVVLLHTNRWVTADALPGILRLARARGLAVVALSELLDQHPGVEARVERSVRVCGGHTAIARR